MKIPYLSIIAILVTIALYPNIVFADMSKSVISVNDTQYDVTFNGENVSINKISPNLHSYVYNSLDMNLTSNKQYNGSLTLTLTKDAVANVFCIARSDVDSYLKSGSALDVRVDNNHEDFTTSATNGKVSLTFDVPKGSQNATIVNGFIGMAVSPLVHFKGIPQTGTYNSGQDVIFNGTLVDACGRHLGVEKVYFTAEQLNVTKEVASDTKGKFSINFTIPANAKSGNYTSKIEMYQYHLAYPLNGVDTLYLDVVANNNQNSLESPLQQFRSGTAASDVKCNDGLQLIIKAEDGYPACVRPENVATLVERGWAKQAPYYHDAHVRPKVTLNDYVYAGIDEEGNTTVSIDNQTYYQTTLNYSATRLPEAVPIRFHNVTFAFPWGTMITPGGAFVMLDVKFPDGFEEIYGTHTANEFGGIPVPTQFGPHLAVNSTTVLSNHMDPQAGMTIYHDKIKLLVSTNKIKIGRAHV